MSMESEKKPFKEHGSLQRTPVQVPCLECRNSVGVGGGARWAAHVLRARHGLPHVWNLQHTVQEPLQQIPVSHLQHYGYQGHVKDGHRIRYRGDIRGLSSSLGSMSLGLARDIYGRSCRFLKRWTGPNRRRGCPTADSMSACSTDLT